MSYRVLDTEIRVGSPCCQTLGKSLAVLSTCLNFPITELKGEWPGRSSLLFVQRHGHGVLEISKALSDLLWIADYKVLSINLSTEVINSFLAETSLPLSF